MKAVRVDEFHKYGCNFYGKLVVVDYVAEVMANQQFGRGLPELDEAQELVKERGYRISRVLLDIPEYVVEVE